MEKEKTISLRAITSAPMQFRGSDAWGEGAFGAPRGERTHRGLDVCVDPGDPVYSPVDGAVVREARPYDDDERYSGLLLRGAGDWKNFEIKLFYVHEFTLGAVTAGQLLGRAQDLSERYSGICNHVHIEVRRHGELVDPAVYFEGSGLA